MIAATYETSQTQKAILLMPRTARGASTSSEELQAQLPPHLMLTFMQLIFSQTVTHLANTKTARMLRIGKELLSGI